MAKKPKLTEKQKAFVEAVVFLNYSYTKAYKSVYNCENSNEATIRKNAHTLAKQPLVKEYMAELSADIIHDKQHTLNKLIEFYEEMMENAEKDADRLRASENLAKLFQLMSDRVELSSDKDAKITFNISTPKKEDGEEE